MKKETRERNRAYDKFQRNKKSDNFYHSEEWKRAKEYVMSIYMGVDIYAYYEHGRLEYADIVHHIIEVKADWDKRLSISNLIPVSAGSHNEIHKEMKKDAYAVQEKLRLYKAKWKKEFGANTGQGIGGG